MTRKNSLTVLAAVAAIIAAPHIASANPGGMEQRHAAVDLQDLDLSTQAGTVEMEQRVTRAAQRLCRNNGDGALQARMAERTCLSDAMQKSKAQMAAAISNASKGG